jgi:hypothetical protein
MEKFYYVMQLEGDPVGPPFYETLEEAKEAAATLADQLFNSSGTRYQVVILSADTALEKPVNTYTNFINLK